MPYSDGTYTSPVQDGPKRTFYPFVNNPTKDTTTKGTVRNYVVLPGSFSPAAALSTDPDDATQYLIEETEPQIDGGIARFSRTYCKVPSDQVVYGSRVITKPDVASAGGVSVGTFYEDITGAAGLGVAYTYSSRVFAPNNKIYGPLISCTSSNSGGNTRLEFSSAHGIAGTETLASRGAGNSSNFGILEPADYSVIDSDTIDILGFNAGANATQIAKYVRDYTPGTDRVGTKSTQKFYLPTVTGGITTPQDIPLPTLLLNDAELLASVIANLTGYQTYDASELEPWRDSPIYTQILIEIDMATL